MSDLHKLFLKRIKQQEQQLGLSLLSEDPEDIPEPFNARQKSDVNLVKTQDHQDIYDHYEAVKNQTFPIIDDFIDDKRHLSFQIYYSPPSSKSVPIFIFHHGAGSSSMTFCKLTQSLKNKYGTEEEHPGIFLFDMRGHGNSSLGKTPDYDISTLTEDFQFIIDEFHHRFKPESSLYLMGHSLGGSILTSYLNVNPDITYNIKGLIMLDIVEETAITSLSTMPSFLSRLPRKFTSYKQAIDWHIKYTRLLKNKDSACISVPDLFEEKTPNELTWKTDLKLTQPYWESWFLGLSSNFITCGSKIHVAKLLILAGHETLDTDLIRGQMQGKYQLIVFNNTNAGHFLHEDIPDHVSVSLLDFAKRNDSPEEYMKKEFGFTPKWGGKINK